MPHRQPRAMVVSPPPLDLAGASSREPGYMHIAKELSRRIRAGEYQVGDRMPSERALADQLGVSRVTTRQAIQVLYHQGLVTRRQGSGTTVNRPAIQQAASLLIGFREQMQMQGIEADARSLSIGIVAGTSGITEALGLPIATPVVKVRQLLVGSGRPLGLTEFYFPASRFPGLEQVDGASEFTELIADRYGVRRASSRMTLSPKAADDEEAALLGVEPGTPLMSAAWVEADHGGWTFCCGSNVYRDVAASFVVVAADGRTP